MQCLFLSLVQSFSNQLEFYFSLSPSHCGNYLKQGENQIETGSKKFKPRINLNHNICNWNCD